jgi:CheY-like chemotaxis protein
MTDNFNIINYTKSIYNELRTPLSIAYSNIDLITLNNKYDELDEQLYLIESSIKYIDIILEKICMFHDNQIKLKEFKPFNIKILVDNINFIMNYIISDKKNKYTINYSISKNVFTWLYGDSINLKHVLLSLLINSIDYSDNIDNNIYFIIKLDNDLLNEQNIIINIIDNNINLNIKNKIFEKYYEGDKIHLGLFLAKQIINLYNGTIEHFFVTNINKLTFLEEHEDLSKVIGNCFQIKIRLKKCNDCILYELDNNYILPELIKKRNSIVHITSIKSTHSNHDTNALPNINYIISKPVTSFKQVFKHFHRKIVDKNKLDCKLKDTIINNVHNVPLYRILVVDDSLINRKMIVALLNKNNNFIIDIAIDGLECINKVCNNINLFDLILMDNNMPNISGSLSTKLLRGINYNKLIIGITGNNGEEDVNNFIKDGVDYIFIKPFNLEKLNLLLAFLDTYGYERISNKKILRTVNNKLEWI